MSNRGEEQWLPRGHDFSLQPQSTCTVSQAREQQEEQLEGDHRLAERQQGDRQSKMEGWRAKRKVFVSDMYVY